MPPVLTSTVPTGSSSATGASGAGSSASSRSDGNGDFGKLLQGGPAKNGAGASKDATGTAGKRPASTPGASTSDAPRSTADAPATDTTGTAPADGNGTTAGSKDAARPGSDKDAPAEDTAAPWPPLGLAGLVLATAPPTEPAPLPGAPPLATDAASTPLPAAPAVTTAPGPALPAAPAAAATAPATDDAPAAPLAMATLLPAHGAATEGDDGIDLSTLAPAPLQGVAPSHDLRTALATAAAFIGEPTPTPVLGDDSFDQAMGARVGWLADQKIGHAHIRLSPDDLGPVDVRLQLNGDKVHASFSSPHVDVRQALESSLPRLRDLLGEQGFQLAHADVGHSPNGGGDAQAGTDQGRGEGGDGEPSRGDTVLPAAQLIRQRGLLDAYA